MTGGQEELAAGEAQEQGSSKGQSHGSAGAVKLSSVEKRATATRGGDEREVRERRRRAGGSGVKDEGWRRASRSEDVVGE